MTNTYGSSHNSVFVFDIETIPDTDSVAALTQDTDAGSTEQELRDRLTQYHLDVTDGRNAFVRQPFHKIVAISFLEAELTSDQDGESLGLQELRSGGREDADEKELIEGFFNYLNRSNARLVSFNGRGFDLPVLKYRAMRHGLDAGNLFKRGDKWNNYSQRYSSDWHCDLLDVFSDYGASARVKMHEAAAALRIPCKMGTSGGDVTALYDAGGIQDIRNYCETDVLCTYLLYIRWCLFSGKMNKKSYNNAVTDVISMIKEECEARSYLAEYYNAWEALCDGKFFVE